MRFYKYEPDESIRVYTRTNQKKYIALLLHTSCVVIINNIYDYEYEHE